MPDLAGRVAAVTGASTSVGAGLAEAMTDAGAVVHSVDPTTWQRRSDADAAFTAVVGDAGRLDIVVHAAVVGAALEARPLVEVDDKGWDAVWERTMRSTIWCCQGAFPHLKRQGGRIVFVTPTISMSGAAGYTPLAVAVEAQRLLAKSAARQWGEFGITVNCLAPAPEHLIDGISADSMTLAPPALGGPGDPALDLGPVAVFLASDASHFVTGVTVCADGGVWMAP
jgi:NAD(P)-dependent dehydrogenase (short-subunit alcohol dehydrogenase family)